MVLADGKKWFEFQVICCFYCLVSRWFHYYFLALLLFLPYFLCNPEEKDKIMTNELFHICDCPSFMGLLKLPRKWINPIYIEKDLHGSGAPRGCTPAIYVCVFYMGPITNTQFHTKYTYIIGQEHNHVMLSDHTSISHIYFGLFPSNLFSTTH